MTFTAFLRDEFGAAAVEYGLLVGLIAVTIITATTQLGQAVQTLFYKVANVMTNVAASPV